MFLQHESVNSWKRNMNKSRASKNPKKYPLPRSIFVPEANGSISSEAKSQSSIISIKISNERDPENVVIEWYRNYRNNKPFNNNNLQPRLNMSKRQSAGGGGGCRSVEIKRSYPCMKCKQLNRKCECAKFRNMYRNIYGPTTDETILVGMETLHNLVSSRCSESRSSVKAVDGTVHQPKDYNHKRDNDRNGGRGRDRDMDDKHNNRSKEKYRDYPSGSDEANIELLELNKRSDDKTRRDSRKAKGNDNGRNGYTKVHGYDDNYENERRQNAALNQAFREDDDTASAYSDLSKFVSSDGITNDFHSDASRLSLESRYTVGNSVSSINSKVTAPNPSPLVSDISNELLADTIIDRADTKSPDTETNNAATVSSKHSLSDNASRATIQTDNGTDCGEEIPQNDINEQITRQDNTNKTTRTNLVKQVPSSSKHHRNQQENAPDQEPDTSSTDEIRDDTAEDTDSTEYKKPSTPLYTCLANPIKNVKPIPVITRYVVPVWQRDKPYPTVHFMSSVKDLTSMNTGAEIQKSSQEPSKNHRDLVEYLLNPMRYLSNISNKENDSLRRSKSDSSLSISSTVRSTTPLFSEATNMIRRDNFCLTEDELNSICSPNERGNKVYIYDTGQRYLPTIKPELMFGKQNNICEKVYYMFEDKNDKATNESARNGSVSNPAEPSSAELSDDENNVMSFTTSSSNICTNSIIEDNNDDKIKDLAESSDDVNNIEDMEQDKTKNEISLPMENRQDVISDISKSPSNTSMKLTDNDGSIMEEGILSLSSLQSNCNSKTDTSTSTTEISNSECNTELLRELNAIANDKTERQVLTPIQEETETSDTETSDTENKASLEENTVIPKLSTEHVKVENIVEANLVQKELTHDTIAIENSLPKQEHDEMEAHNDTSESNPGTTSQSEEIIVIKQAPNNFDFVSSVYSPAPTTCSCFTICKTNDDDADTVNGKKTMVNDKQINTTPVRIKRESKYQQTDPIKLRPIKSKGDTNSTAATSTRTTVSTDSTSVRRGKRRSTGTMSRTRKSSTKSQSVKFERKFSKGDACVEEILSECLDSVTADEAKSKEIISDHQEVGGRSRSDQKLANRNLQSRETRYAIARITKYDEFTTYEILKSTRAKPRIIPQTTEGVFTVRNRKKRKLKL